MEIVIVLILITIFLVYINFFKKENFESSPKCEFIPWGPSKRACIDRCRVDRDLWGGDACTMSNCYSICNSCVDNDKCKWLNSRDFLEEERKKLEEKETNDPEIVIRGIEGNKNCIINFIHESNVNMYLLKYYESSNPGSGIKIFKLKNPKQGLNSINIKNLKNNISYSFIVVPLINSKIYKSSNMVELIPSDRLQVDL